MKLLLSLALLIFVTHAQSACKNADPKKVVLMMAFHEGSEEVKGAAQGACQRGETLVVLPKPSPEDKARDQRFMQDLLARAEQIANRDIQCQDQACHQQTEAANTALMQEFQAHSQAPKHEYQEQLDAFMKTAEANGTKVSSLIVSGHDGGGHFYGDFGETDMAALSQMTKDHPGIFGNTSSLMLMGCWSATPDQVDQWRVIFPKLRVLGGFVGSAPASTRIAAGTYISGLLRGEKNLPSNANKASVQAMLNSVQNLNAITSGVYVNPLCEDDGRSPAFYYISPANNENELPNTVHAGLNVLASPDQKNLACMKTFGGSGFKGSYDWNAVLQYYQGEKEPENNNELRSLYSYIRNNENCFKPGLSNAAVSPDQILFLRFFQDVKKNINKYYKKEFEDFYKMLGVYVDKYGDPEVKAAYLAHKHLVGDSLIGMTRKETLEQISVVQGIYDKIFSSGKIPDDQENNDNSLSLNRTFHKMQTHLYQLQCMPPTWHEYVEKEALDPPTCDL